jgi:hypothetical protein
MDLVNQVEDDDTAEIPKDVKDLATWQQEQTKKQD